MPYEIKKKKNQPKNNNKIKQNKTKQNTHTKKKNKTNKRKFSFVLVVHRIIKIHNVQCLEHHNNEPYSVLYPCPDFVTHEARTLCVSLCVCVCLVFTLFVVAISRTASFLFFFLLFFFCHSSRMFSKYKTMFCFLFLLFYFYLRNYPSDILIIRPLNFTCSSARTS